jgi:hypothetical protein
VFGLDSLHFANNCSNLLDVCIITTEKFTLKLLLYYLFLGEEVLSWGNLNADEIEYEQLLSSQETCNR